MPRKIITRETLRKRASSGYRVTEQISVRGQERVNLVTPAGYPQTRTLLKEVKG